MTPSRLKHIEGSRFCVVFVKVVDPESERVRLQCLHGQARVDSQAVRLVTDEGAEFTLPTSALPSVLPSDGTAMLKDAEYFAMVKIDPNVEFFNSFK
ncbi:MAG: hypothetical protein ACOCWJ_01175 [Verrucomicrobiota bacterium]